LLKFEFFPGEIRNVGERSRNDVCRKINLPGSVDARGINAVLANGILKVTVPKMSGMGMQTGVGSGINQQGMNQTITTTTPITTSTSGVSTTTGSNVNIGSQTSM